MRRVIISLPGDLRTTQNIGVSFAQDTEGDVEVITEPLRLIHKIFYSLHSLFDEM